MASKRKRIRLVPADIRRMAREGHLRLSRKVRETIATTSLDVEDLRSALDRGELLKKETDERKEAPWKYTVIGPGLSGRKVYSTGKIPFKRPDRYFVMTAHWADEK